MPESASPPPPNDEARPAQSASGDLNTGSGPPPLPVSNPVVPETAAKAEEEALAAKEEIDAEARWMAHQKHRLPLPTPGQEEHDLELAKKEAELEGLKQDIKAREKYARHIFRLILGWLIAMFLLLLLQGFLSDRQIVLFFGLGHSQWHTNIHFRLSDAVLLATIGGTTANVLGLFIFVVQYLFPRRGT